MDWRRQIEMGLIELRNGTFLSSTALLLSSKREAENECLRSVTRNRLEKYMM